MSRDPQTGRVPTTGRAVSSGRSAVSGRATLGGPFTPAELPGLTLWLRADLGVTIATGISQWSDQSGSGHHLIQAAAAAQPSLLPASGPNGTPCASFASAGAQYLAGTFGLAQPLDGFLVFAWTSTAAQASVISAPTSGNALRVYHAAGSNTNLHLVGDAAGAKDLLGSGANTNNYHYYEAIWAGATSSLRQDGVTVIAVGDAGSSAPSGVVLGAFQSGTTDFMNGGIAEVAIYSRILSAAERARVTTYLKTRYAL